MRDPAPACFDSFMTFLWKSSEKTHLLFWGEPSMVADFGCEDEIFFYHEGGVDVGDVDAKVPLSLPSSKRPPPCRWRPPGSLSQRVARPERVDSQSSQSFLSRRFPRT